MKLFRLYQLWLTRMLDLFPFSPDSRPYLPFALKLGLALGAGLMFAALL